MALISTSINRVLTVLQDTSKLNFQVPELAQYFNLALGYLSRELAKWNARIGVSNTTLTYTAGVYSQALPSDFLALATNEEGDKRIFNATNSYARLAEGFPSDLDDWEVETAANTGVVDTFVIDTVNLIVHPRPKASTTIKFYYHPLQSIVDDSSTMPWGGWFTDAIEQFVLRQCHLRTEMGAWFQVNQGDYNHLSQVARDILYQRENTKIRMIPRIGWSS